MKLLTGAMVWILLSFRVTRSQRNAGLVASGLSTTGMQEIFTFPGISDVTNSKQIYSLPISKTAKITGLASNPRQQDLFVLNAGAQRVIRVSNFNIWMNQTLKVFAIKTAISRFSQIAFDWVSNNIYWTDMLYKWIGMIPGYGNDTSMFKIVLHEDMSRPYGIELDPLTGLLFWSDVDINNVRIERATLTGENRRTLIYKNLIRVTDLTIDSTTRTLFWVDGARNTVESCTYDGENRRVIIRVNNMDFTSLDYHKDSLFISTLVAAKLVEIKVHSGKGRILKGYNFKRAYTLHMFDEDRYPIQTDLCQSANCQHMCVNTDQGPRCLCKANYKLSSNGKTCTASSTNFERSILASNGTHICLFDVQLLTNFGHQYISYTGFGNVGFIVPARDGMFFFERNTKVINYVTWDRNISLTVNDAGDVSVIVYTWVDELIFWIDTASSTIKLKDLSFTTTLSTDIYGNLVRPSCLTMDQHGRSLFFINGNLGSKEIVKGNTVGDKLQTIYGSSKLANPTDLYYDLTSHRLFYIDGGQLASIEISGSGKIAYFTTGSESAFLIYKEFALWIKGTNTFFIKNSNITSKEYALTVPGIGKIESIAIHDPFLMTDKRGPCLALNGRCDHICLPGSNTTLCKCHHGFQLQSDNRTCDSNPLQSDFVIVADLTHQRLYQIPLSGGKEIALDIANVGNPSGIVYNNFTQRIIWFDLKTKRIKSSDLHGIDDTTYMSNGKLFAERFAIDTSTGNVYFTTDSSQGNISYIGVLKMTTFPYKTLIPDLGSARDIVLYPSKGLLFWTDHGNYAYIGKATMDGVLRSRITHPDFKWPNGITIDYNNEKIYWTDGYFNTIRRCDLNGTNVVTIAYDKESHLMDIQVMGAYLYYVAWNRRKVTKINKSNGEIVDWMRDSPELGRIDSLDVFPGDPQPINSICADRNGQCSTFCLPNERGRSCACPDGINLKSDGRTCEGVTLCPSDIPHGVLSPSCLRYVNEKCQYTCTQGYMKRPDVDVINCGIFGMWSEEIDNLCEEIKCPQVFDRGNITADCYGIVGAQCPYECLEGYKQKPDVTFLTCLSNGQWDQNFDMICEEIKCTNESDRVNISKDCTAKIGAICSYTCLNSYKPIKDAVLLTCMKNGEWDHDIQELCEAITFSPVTDNNRHVMRFIVVSSVIVSTAVIIGIIVLVICRRKKSSHYVEGSVVYRSKHIYRGLSGIHSSGNTHCSEVNPISTRRSYVDVGDVYYEIDDKNMLCNDDKQSENEVTGDYLTPCLVDSDANGTYRYGSDPSQPKV